MAELLAALTGVNLAAALAILTVLAVRPVARRMFGAQVAYSLWAIPPAAGFATLLPARVVEGASALGEPGLAASLLALWLAGAILMVLWLAILQMRFLRLARAGRTGPAVIGVIAPRLVMPPDDGAYSDEERALVRAHEREHIARGDPWANALLAAMQCLCWFNPLVHLAAGFVRLDQELACDAAVVRRRGVTKAAYARALLKVQMSGVSLPLGARWLTRGAHPLELRIASLARPPRLDTMAGPILVTAALTVAIVAAWAGQPPVPERPRLVPQMVGDDRPMSVVIIRTAPHARP
ncbi:MAG: M56 family metallopeptidase [Pseudomonadota bacterium]|uniref:M56 family metallopeptidase n=1 Tax=Phenylobacterium sp. TaxID=1871053 RepID=UPI0025FE1323|nr:M56 family metallopeptidase [Phenylobacterium sp.]MBT9472635.1 peptidase M56 [Phenylobacterium sp.]